MKNTKFRKRALLSSVAMLLVALVALGSATFAWFVDDPTADAKGITAKAQSSTGLQIKTDSSTTWSHHANLAKNGSTAISGIMLSPAMTSTNDTTKWHFVVAADASASTAKAGAKWQAVEVKNHDSGNCVYMENITLRKTGDRSTAEKVYLNKAILNAVGTMGPAVNILLTNASTGAPIVALNTTGTAPAIWNTAITDGDGTTTGTTFADPAGSVTTKQVGTYSTAADAVEIGTFNSSTEEIALKMYVWLDGNNSLVKSDNAVSAADIIKANTTSGSESEGVELYFCLASHFGS